MDDQDTLHFKELLDISKSTFPQADYGGTWLDLGGLLTLLQLSVLNKEDKATSWGSGRPDKLNKFAQGLEHEVAKAKRHFHVMAVGLIKAWRGHYAPDTVGSLGQSIPSQDVLSEPKLGQSARYCWEYALISHACLVRIKESHDEHFAHHPWKVDFDHYFKGPQRMIPPLLLEEVYAVSMLCSPLGKHDHEGGQDQGLTASVRAQNSAKRFFENGLFNCSFTMRSSAAHRLMPGSVDHYCPACTKTKLTKPRGMGACGHIVCEQCLRGVMQKHHHGVHSIMAHALGGGGPEHVPCPLCKTRNATSQVMDMPAVGSWIAQQ